MVFARGKGVQFGTLTHYRPKTDAAHLPVPVEKKKSHCYNPANPCDGRVLISIQPDSLTLIGAVMRETGEKSQLGAAG